MRRQLVFIIVINILLFSCSDKYQAFRSNYTFKSKDGKPDYADLNYWAAHPWKWDPSDSVPKPLLNEPIDSTADVFFLYPTSYTRKAKKKNQNAAIDDDYINAKTDYSSVLYQASVFNNQCRVFAPRYRQAHIANFFSTDKEKAAEAFSMAYEDIKAAFEFYLQTWNKERPFIIAAHSQGSFLAERLLKEYFDVASNPDNTNEGIVPLKNKLVAAYIIGWPVPKNYFTSLKMCTDSLQTGCICSWRTVRKGFIPYRLKNDKSNNLVTNPLSWTTGSEYISRQMNKGSVLTNFNKVYKQTTDAQISNSFLNVNKPKFPWSFLYFSRNYHVGDINLFYMNIRDNVRQRINSYWKR